MAFRYTFRVDSEEAMTVPYGPLYDDVRANRGFVDLRGRPDRALEIVEGIGSDALRDLLTRLARPGSSLFTLGCDLGEGTGRTSVPRHRREFAGGYIQVVSMAYDRTPPDAYAAFARTLVSQLEAGSADDRWEADIVGKWVYFNFTGEPIGQFPSLWIYFHAFAGSQTAAIESRERLVGVIGNAFVDSVALQPLKEEAGDES